jgi:hypothetical protein
MTQPLTLEAMITADGQLEVELPADVPRGRVLLTLVAQPQDPVLHALRTASIDEEPLSPEDADAIAEALVERSAHAVELASWSGFSLAQAMRGMEDEPDVYSQADLEESFS